MIAGGGFALMAWQLAKQRASVVFFPGSVFGPCGTRAEAATGWTIYQPEIEFYRILDKAAACFEHRSAMFMGGTVRGPYRCAL